MASPPSSERFGEAILTIAGLCRRRSALRGNPLDQDFDRPLTGVSVNIQKPMIDAAASINANAD
jgi:hypothetical protein